MKKFLSNKKGVSTVEFALTVAFYFFVVCLILEFCRISITTAYWDLAITESVREAKNQAAAGNDYKTAFEKALQNQKITQDNSPIGYLALSSKNTYDVQVKYVDCLQGRNCIKALLADKYKMKPDPSDPKKQILSNDGTLATLAVYTIDFKYNFMFSLPFLSTAPVDRLIKREFITVQEYNRSQFQFNTQNNN